MRVAELDRAVPDVAPLIRAPGLWRNDNTRMKSRGRCRARSPPATVPPGLEPALGAGWIWVGGTDWGCNMPSIFCAGIPGVGIRASRIRPDARPAAAAANAARLSAVALAGALLAACAQSSVVSRNSGFQPTSRQASLPHDRTASFVTSRRVASTNKHTPFASRKDSADTPVASQGLASFYSEGTRTASG